jgi:hypothetical protein
MKTILLCIAALFNVSLSQAQWEPDVRLTNDPAYSWPSANSNAKVLASSGDTLYIVWSDYRNGKGEIYFKCSKDNGTSWEADTRLTNNANESFDPSLLVSGSSILVAWSDDRDGNSEIYYKRSEDRGLTWGEDTRLTNAARNSNSPVMAMSGSVLHIVWYDDRDDPAGVWNTEIYYKRSADGGLTWDPDVRLTNKAAYAGLPGIVLFGSTVLVVWEDDRDGNGEIYYKQSGDEGLTWEPDTRLTNEPGNSWDPCISSNDSVVHVVWMDDRDGGGYEVYYNRSMDGGVSWSSDTRLTNAAAPSKYPTIAVSGTRVHVTWQDQRDMNYEIYYKRSEDAGLTWQEDTRLTNAFGASEWPHVGVADAALHVIWYDDRNGNDEIYYKRNPTGNIAVGIENDPVNAAGQQPNIRPNPASGLIRLDFGLCPVEKARFSIRNILGEVVLTGLIQEKETLIDVSGLQNGLYFVEIISGRKQTHGTKLVILK